MAAPLAMDFPLRWAPPSRVPIARPFSCRATGVGMYTEQALWSMAREKVDVTVILLKNDAYGILEIELARVRVGDANAKMDTMMHLNHPTLNWIKIAEGHGVAATRAVTAEEFHQQLATAMNTPGPHLIEAQVVQNLQPMIDAVYKTRVL